MARPAAAAIRLDAVAAAKRVHRELDLKERVTEAGGLIDIFEVIEDLGIPLVFKPLNSALGLCLPAPLRGIMVTTRRGLHIQRFTAAHELGHVVLEHAGSVDREILERAPQPEDDERDLREVAADAFAAEMMLPRWLYRHHIRAQGWTVASHLHDPDVVYQLALRMGTSYEAACWGLLSHQILNYADVTRLRNARVAKIKHRLGEEHRPGSSWSDVWRLTERDNGARLIGNPDDLLRIELDEAAGSGHQWQIEALREAGYSILSDQSDFSREPLHYGASSRRTVIVRPPESGIGDVTIYEVQPWAGTLPDDTTFSIELALEGPEAGGMSRAARRRFGGQS